MKLVNIQQLKWLSITDFNFIFKTTLIFFTIAMSSVAKDLVEQVVKNTNLIINKTEAKIELLNSAKHLEVGKNSIVIRVIYKYVLAIEYYC